MIDEALHILVADDEPGMRVALREVLRRGGWEAELAESAEEALDMLADGDEYALLITDHRMPGKSGLDLIREARTLRPEMPCVMMTAFGTIEDAVLALREGAVDYLLKPFSFATVIEVVQRALSARSSAKAIATRETSADISVRRNGGAPIVAASDRVIAKAAAMRSLIEMAMDVADSPATVLLSGESGTGKEVLARLIHETSRRKGPLVAVNCAALPEGLLESELFGHEKGAFTGALADRKGRFELAQNGTLLLDEISELPLPLQAKLLRVIQERELTPVGSALTVRLDVRIVATTNRDLETEVREGRFRQDLYYRLNVIALAVPPLRERPADIRPLAELFLARYRHSNRPARELSEDAVAALMRHDFPGNVRELENMIERACLLAREPAITAADLRLSGASDARAGFSSAGIHDACVDFAEPYGATPPLTLEEMERRLITTTLERTGGNRTRTAEMLGVSVRTIRNKVNQYGLAAAGAS